MYSVLESASGRTELKLSIHRKGKQVEVTCSSTTVTLRKNKNPSVQKGVERVYRGGIKNALSAFYEYREKKIKQKYKVLRSKKMGAKLALMNPLPAKAKKPTSVKPHVGIELEFVSPYDKKALAQLFKGTGLERYINLKEDVSVDHRYWGKSLKHKLADYFAHEISLLIKEDEMDIVHRVIEILNNQALAKVNKTCGVHVHLDMRNRNVEDSYTNLVESQKWLFKLNPERRKNYFCKPVKIKDFNHAVKKYLSRDGFLVRSHSINPHSFAKFKTLEVRLHRGSLDSERIVQWTKLLIKIVEGRNSGSVHRLTGMQKRFNLSQTQVEFIKHGK